MNQNLGGRISVCALHELHFRPALTPSVGQSYNVNRNSEAEQSQAVQMTRYTQRHCRQILLWYEAIALT